MLKAQVFRRSFSLFNRVPASRVIRAASRNGHQTIQIQRVHIRKPLISRSLLIGTCVTSASLYAFLRWLEDDDDEGGAKSHPAKDGRPQDGKWEVVQAGDEDDDEDEDEDEDEYDDSLLFIPTGFSRPRPREFYRGSDPEWQEFVRIAPDRSRMDRVRGELVALVRSLATNNPAWERRLGKINPNAGSAWIEYTFPDGPPIEYERPGIELTEDGTLRRSTRPVHEFHHHQLSNALWPAPAATAVYDDAKRRAWRLWRNFKIYVGWEKKHSISDFNQMLSGPGGAMFPYIPKPLDSPNTKSPDPLSPSPTPPTDGGPQQRTTAPSDHSPRKDPSTTLSDATAKLTKISVPLPAVNSGILRQQYAILRQPYKPQPPRGTFLVTGLVEIIGQKARMTLDVSAAYDPRIGKFVTLDAKMRSLVNFRQEPKGGP
ncbi:hypothetical protein BS50DRAFT_291557 [Corynespora cassiicola Philippines]|uniref:Uncharacterized protein n=1 Tax=Corynespora cassiicola Philippines TaxID=1448308 RepID=A0A2T2NVZ4_CORCC|nr:hypothetical protein BS50DRAFT_291557 [Corynespora cassiicola Philippines]